MALYWNYHYIDSFVVTNNDFDGETVTDLICFMQCLFDNGQHVVLGAGELHLEVCLQDLEDEHAGVAIKVLITFHTRF